MAGASVAAELADRARVLVIERESQPGYHSTGRSAALFSEIYGSKAVRALSRASRGFFYDPPLGFAEAPLVRRRGSLFVATRAQIPALETFAAQPDIAAATQRLTRTETLALVPILRPEAALASVFEPDSADVDVHGLHQDYLRRLRSSGGEVVTDADVVGLSRSRGLWTARTTAGDWTAPTIVNASGAWADVIGALAGVRPIGLQPMRRTALLVDPPAGVEIDAWPMVIDIDEEFYFKPDAGQILISPADETPSDPCDVQPDEWDVAVAVDRVMTATTLDIRRIRHRWAGLRSFVADRTPVAGFDSDLEGFFWLAGQGGYGIQTAPALSRTAAALVLGDEAPDDVEVSAEELSPARLR